MNWLDFDSRDSSISVFSNGGELSDQNAELILMVTLRFQYAFDISINNYYLVFEGGLLCVIY